MSLSLSSLLNPSDESGTRPSSPPLSQADSHPPLDQNVQSQEEHRLSSSPTSTRSTRPQIHPPTTAHEAAQALAALSTSPVPTQSQWFGSRSQDYATSERRVSNEQRPGSGYGEPIQLPPPPPQDSARKMSSPTLEQYQIASRSPEQRRASMVSPTQSNITLPPIQAFATSAMDNPRRSSFGINQDLPPLPSQKSASHASAPLITTSSIPAIELGLLSANPPQLHPTAGQLRAEDDGGSSPAVIKQEKMPTPQPPSPMDGRRISDVDPQPSKTLNTLKTGHGARTRSPLRDSSIPLPTTETSQPEQAAPNKKRPASAKTKKGTATTMKKAPPAKKRKLEPARSATPLSHVSKSNGKVNSSKGTPANSSPASSTRSQSAEPNEEAYDEDEDEEMDDDPDADVYCICRRPDNGTFMIGCDGTCDDWFHGKCVGIDERDKNLIDKYICPNCTKASIGRTTWKRMCRRHGCRQPAKVGKAKGGGSGSKYCSDECGVLYFRELAGRTRGREEAAKNRSTRRKSTMNNEDKPSADDDLGARGGLLSAGEVKAILNVSGTAEDFHTLGDGVLSPPATPDGKQTDDFTDSEQRSLASIYARKEDARHRHASLKDRMKFVTMVKQAASRVATEKELKPKEYCGYDSRLEWTEEQFQRWRNSKAGQQAFELDSLSTEPSTNGADAMNVDVTVTEHNDNDDDDDEDFDICDRKKCARHLEWSKLAVDDLRFEMSDNGDRMRALDKEEKSLRERAALRAKAGITVGEGSVEIHQIVGGGGGGGGSTCKSIGLGVIETVESTEAMAVDAV